MATKPLSHIKSQSFIQMGNDITIQMQCISAIVGHFRWRKVIAIYEYSSSFSSDLGLITHLSDSLHLVDSIVHHHVAFPPIPTISDPHIFIEDELKKLRTKNVKVFTILQSSLDFAMILFDKAKMLGMMEKGYVWIVSDDLASLFDSIQPSAFINMQGVIGFKTHYVENSESFKQFKPRFSRNYRFEYPEEEHASPSIHALLAYDATWTVAKALKNSKGKMKSSGLVKYILASTFEGLTGKIDFKDGQLLRKPIFQIINVIGRSYREITLWSPKFGFLEEITSSRNGLPGNLDSIYWPGGQQIVPKGWTLDGIEKPLRIGVPATGAFQEFVNVTYDQETNTTLISGFSVEVFEAAVRELPYYLSYVLVPYYGSYDEMLVEISKKVNRTLDAGVGDIGILADRYEIVEFSQSYIESGLVMLVTEKEDVKKAGFIVTRAFKIEMWVLMAGMTMCTGIVIWLTEHVSKNPEFQGSFPESIGSMLWFSITILSFAQRESIKCNLSRLVLTAWLFVVFVVSSCLTANLASMMTVPRLQPSEVNVDYLRSSNAPIGCNGNSFFERYLVTVLRFKLENVKRFYSINDYPRAFERGEIRAAFLVVPHAKVFLAKYCKGYTLTGPRFKLGGLGFVFPKGSPLATDISEAILKITQNGKIDQLEEEILSSSNCSSTKRDNDDDPIGLVPFYGLFLISGTISAIVFFITLIRLLKLYLSMYSLMMNRRAVRFTLRFLSKSIFRGRNKQMDQNVVAIELAITEVQEGPSSTGQITNFCL